MYWMVTNPRGLLPVGVPYIALPDSVTPKIMIPLSTPWGRWKFSGVYPAFKPLGKVRRQLVRMKATLGYGAKVRAGWDNADLIGHLRDVLPEIEAVSLLIGAEGPAQSVILQAWGNSRAIAYAKYAESPVALRRLYHEHELLCSIPAGVGPEVLALGAWGQGALMVTEAIGGKQLGARPPVARRFKRLIETLTYHGTDFAIDRHPWIMEQISNAPTGVQRSIESLARKKWPVVYQHGDLTPWNVLDSGHGGIRTIDWEYGTLQGFPYIDIAHYCLQSSYFIRDWSPTRARRSTVRYLSQPNWPGLDQSEAQSIVTLAAHYASAQAGLDGVPTRTRLEVWRRSVLEEHP